MYHALYQISAGFGLATFGFILICGIALTYNFIIKLYNISKVFDKYFTRNIVKETYKLNDEIFRDLGIDFNCGHFDNTKYNIESLKRRLDSLELDVDKPRRPIKHKK